MVLLDKNENQNKHKTKNKHSLKHCRVVFQIFTQKYYTWQNNAF